MFFFRSHKFALNFNFIERNTMRSKKKKHNKKLFTSVSAWIEAHHSYFHHDIANTKPVAFCCWHRKYTQHVMSLSHHARGEQRIELFFLSCFWTRKRQNQTSTGKSFRGWQNLLAHSQWYSISSCQLETYTFECAALITTFIQI